MKIKRVLAGAISVASIVALMAGCSQSGDKGKDEERNSKIPIDSISLPAKLEGNVIKILGYAGWEGEHEDIRKILKEAYGATVEYTVLDNFQWSENKIATELASGNAYDFVISDKRLRDKKLIEPLDKYFDLEDPVFKNVKKQIESQRAPNGQLYGVTSTTYPQVIVYNKAMFEKNGLEDPLETYKKGNWTFDTFNEVSKVLSAQTGGNGKKRYAFSSWDPTNFLTANGTYYVKQENGKTILNMDDPKLAEALKYFRDLSFTNKTFTSWQGWSYTDFQSGQLAMMMDRYGNKTASADFDFDWDIVPFPTGPSGDKNCTPGTVGYYGIGTGSKNPSGGAAYIYLFCRQDYLKRGEYLRGYLSEEQAKLYEELQGKVEQVLPLDGITDPNKLMYDMVNGADVAAKIQEYKPVWQAQLDDYASTYE